MLKPAEATQRRSVVGSRDETRERTAVTAPAGPGGGCSRISASILIRHALHRMPRMTCTVVALRRSRRRAGVGATRPALTKRRRDRARQKLGRQVLRFG